MSNSMIIAGRGKIRSLAEPRVPEPGNRQSLQKLKWPSDHLKQGKETIMHAALEDKNEKVERLRLARPLAQSWRLNNIASIT
jgi:hypothetical protein